MKEDDIKDVMNRASDMFHENTQTILNLLTEGANNE